MTPESDSKALGGKLYISAPDEQERTHVIEGAIVRIGRSPAPQNDVVLNHGWISREHARIYCDRLPYRIQDMESSNGTSVNDTTIPRGELRPLNDGDVIAIGPFRLRYEAPPPPQGEIPPEIEDGRLGGLRVREAPQTPPPTPPREPPVVTRAGPRPPERWPGMPTLASRWLQYLPPIYGEDPFMGRFLLIFEDLLGPAPQTIHHFDQFLDPMTTPESFLPWLNNWMAGIAEEHWPPEVRRRLLKDASWLYQTRGTAAGLRRFLELCTDGDVDIAENVDGPHTFRVVLHTRDRPADRRLVERIIQINCPAHTAFTLEIV